MSSFKRDKSGRFISRKPASRPAPKKSTERPTPKKPIKRLVPKTPVSRLVPKKPASRLDPKKPIKRLVPKKPASRPVSKKQVKRPVPRKPAKRPVTRKPVKRPVPRKPVKRPVPRKPAKRPVLKKPAKRPVLKKPAKRPVLKKPVKRPAPRKPTKRPVLKKPAKRPVTRKPAKRPVLKKPAKRPVPKKGQRLKSKRPKSPRLPPISERSLAAEVEIQKRLVNLSQMLTTVEPTLDVGTHSFVNMDKTVDGELRIGSLPDYWREPEGLPDLISTLSNAFHSFSPFERNPPFGGSFWFSIGVRFGARNEAELEELSKLYKRSKGTFQIGTYPVRADHATPMQICLVDDQRGLRGMISSLAEKRGLPPSTILLRFTWGPDWQPGKAGTRPGHYKGEKGEKGKK